MQSKLERSTIANSNHNHNFQGKRGELHLSKFGNGTNGKSIKYKGNWMTPDEYEQVRTGVNIQGCQCHTLHFQACGSKTRKYLDTITTDYGPLKTLTASGMACNPRQNLDSFTIFRSVKTSS